MYIDGARIGSALVSEHADFTLEDIADFADAFFIGGTKNGALFGEAIVLVNDDLKHNYRYALKQRGFLLAKGAVLGIQFTELFKDNLFFDLACHADSMARKLVKALQDYGADFRTPPQTNMIFPVLPLDVVEKLEKNFNFYRWSGKQEDKVCIRLLTSWATPESDVNAFAGALEKL